VLTKCQISPLVKYHQNQNQTRNNDRRTDRAIPIDKKHPC